MAEITDVRLELMRNGRTDSRLLACGTIEIDHEFVIDGIKVIRGNTGFIIAMPNRKQRYPCWHCKEKQAHDANFCSCCGAPKPLNHIRNLEHKNHDIAFPATREFRAHLESVVLKTLEHLQAADAETNDRNGAAEELTPPLSPPCSAEAPAHVC